jgi:hypothetical protein
MTRFAKTRGCNKDSNSEAQKNEWSRRCRYGRNKAGKMPANETPRTHETSHTICVRSYMRLV